MTPLRLHVTSWVDPQVDASGHPARSPYVEIFWMPIIGPSAMVLFWRLNTYLDNEPDGHTFDLDELGRQLGLGTSESEHTPLARALSLLVRFGLAKHSDSDSDSDSDSNSDSNSDSGGLAVRRAVGPLSEHYLSSISPVLQEVHRLAFSDETACDPGLLATVP